MVSNKTLFKICLYGGISCISAVMLLRYKIQEQVRNTEFYRKAFQILRSDAGAIKLLGEPIKDKGFDLGDSENNFFDANHAKLEINIAGQLDKGKMFFSADRNEENWIIKKIELEIESHPDKRLLIKNVE